MALGLNPRRLPSPLLPVTRGVDVVLVTCGVSALLVTCGVGIVLVTCIPELLVTGHASQQRGTILMLC